MSQQGDSPSPGPRPGERHPPVPHRVPPVVLQGPPVRTAVLDYEVSRASKQPSTPLPVQFLLGLFSPILYGVVAVLIVGAVADPRIMPASVLIWCAVAGYILLVLWIRIGLRWRAFIPGILVTILGIPLILLAICGAMLGGL